MLKVSVMLHLAGTTWVVPTIQSTLTMLYQNMRMGAAGIAPEEIVLTRRQVVVRMSKIARQSHPEILPRRLELEGLKGVSSTTALSQVQTCTHPIKIMIMCSVNTVRGGLGNLTIVSALLLLIGVTLAVATSEQSCRTAAPQHIQHLVCSAAQHCHTRISLPATPPPPTVRYV